MAQSHVTDSLIPLPSLKKKLWVIKDRALSIGRKSKGRARLGDT